MSVVLAFVVGLIALYIIKYYANVRRYPKGPTPLPLIGNFHQFVRYNRLHLFFEECQAKYGSVFTVFTPFPKVIVMELKDIKEALITKVDDYAGRSGQHPDTVYQYIPNGGVLFSDGDEWREQRRTSVHIMRDFGMGKEVMERQVLSSIEDCLAHTDTLLGAPVDFRWPIQILVANVINHMLFGYFYPFNDCARLMAFSDGLTWQFERIRKNPLTLVANQLPSIKHVPYLGWYAVNQYKENIGKLYDIIKEDIRRCMETYDPEAEPESFVHAYMNKAKTNDLLSTDQMVNVCFDFFLAGMETTSTTLRWGMLFMADNQEAQERVRQEIHSVIGRDRLPRMADRAHLPYTCAMICELQRQTNILPVNLNHRAIKEGTIAGHRIPANAIVIPQVSNVLKRDPGFGEHPEQFRPERFLMSDLKTPNKEAMEPWIPFSLGRRQCAGEGLARMELFLGMVSLMQRYRVEPMPGQKINLEPIVGPVILPPLNYLHVERV